MNSMELGTIVLRTLFTGVYLYAWYRNIRNASARQWTLTHTALLLNLEPDQAPKSLTKFLAITSMVTMFVGAGSVLLGLEPRLGAGLLAVFTAGGILQHRREVQRAMRIADRVKPNVAGSSVAEFEELRWSAFAGNFSSGLKNFALLGVCILIMCTGTGAWSISDRIGVWLAEFN